MTIMLLCEESHVQAYAVYSKELYFRLADNNRFAKWRCDVCGAGLKQHNFKDDNPYKVREE